MTSIRKKYEDIGQLALRELRKSKLGAGHPFMINSFKLPSDQCYFEYPDGSFQLVTICRIESDFKVVRTLSKKEQNALRKLLAPIS